MIECDESDKMIKIDGKMDKSNTYKCLVVVIFHSFIPRTSSDETFFKFFYIQADEEKVKTREKIKI